ncbi:MAG: metallophosphoesterase [Psychromonas sp.]
MRILHLSDLHFDQKIFYWIKEQQETCDVICLTGDFVDLSSKAKFPLSEQISWIIKFLNSLEKPVFLCSGNHDVEEQNINDISLDELFNIDDIEADFEYENSTFGESVWLNNVSISGGYLDGAIHEINGITFGCTSYLSNDLSKYRKCDILLRHVPPAKTKVSVGPNGDYGCEDLFSDIKNGLLRPRYILCGHIHDPISHVDELCGVNLLNPGFGYHQGIPKHIYLEL